MLKGAPRAAVQARLEHWLAARIDARLEPLLALARRGAKPKPAATRALPAQARGIAHQLAENFGSLDRDAAGAAGKARPAAPRA